METNSVWVSGPLIPVTVTVYEPGTIEESTPTVRVAEPEPSKADGAMDAIMPVTEVEAERLIELLNPCRETAVMIDVPVDPEFMVRTSGSGERVKSGPVTRTSTVA